MNATVKSAVREAEFNKVIDKLEAERPTQSWLAQTMRAQIVGIRSKAATREEWSEVASVLAHTFAATM